MNTLLVIEDDARLRSNILDLLEAEGFRGIGADSGKQGVELALQQQPDVVICDTELPELDGYEVFELLSVQPPTAAIPFLFLSAPAERADVRHSTGLGADHFLTKPFTRVELLDAVHAQLQRGRDVRSLRHDRSSQLQVKSDRAAVRHELVVRDPKLKALVAQVERVARAPIAVLILGEPGVGKELLAETVHACSGRTGPFVALSCAALPETLLERELFGHEKGGLTSAGSPKEGLLEAANGGTLFLDDVGELPPATQVKLLRVIEERKVLRVGARTARSIDVRLISATDRDLDKAIEDGHFRADLYYRLNGFSLTVPPLRERPADLEALAQHFVSRAPRNPARAEAPQLSEAAKLALAAYRWPGNVRELRAVLERAVLLCEGSELGVEHLSVQLVQAPRARAREAHRSNLRAQLRRRVEQLDRQRIRDALAQCGGNQTQAADLLGISRRTLVTRLGQYHLPRPRASCKRGREG